MNAEKRRAIRAKHAKNLVAAACNVVRGLRSRTSDKATICLLMFEVVAVLDKITDELEEAQSNESSPN